MAVDGPAQSLKIGGQPEIEQDDTAFDRDKDVGWLDVPVQLSRLVERVDAFRQLPQCVAKPRLVEPRIEPSSRAWTVCGDTAAGSLKFTRKEAGSRRS